MSLNPYETTSWSDGQAPALNAENLNKIETGIDDVTDEVIAIGTEIATARGPYDDLAERLANTAAPTDAQVAEALSDYIEENPELFNYVVPQQFGAKADGETDDTEAIQAAIDASDVVYFPAGNYLINCDNAVTDTSEVYGISIPSNKTLILDRNAVLIKKGSYNNYEQLLYIPADSSNVKIAGGKIKGDRLYKMENYTVSQVKAYHGNSYGIRLYQASNVTIRDMIIEDFAGDGVSISARDGYVSQNIEIINCLINKNFRNGINLSKAQGVVIRDCHINNSGYNLNNSGSTVVISNFASAYADKIDIEEHILQNQTEAKEIANLIDREIIDGSFTYTGSKKSDPETVTSITTTATYRGWKPRCGIDIESNDLTTLYNKNIQIVNCAFSGNLTNDIDLAGRNGDISIIGCVCNTRIQSSRPWHLNPSEGKSYELTDSEKNVVISGCQINQTILHGEKIIGSRINEVTIANTTVNDNRRESESLYESCEILKISSNDPVISNCDYFNNCVVFCQSNYIANKARIEFNGCSFIIHKGAYLNFNGSSILNNSSVLIDSDFTTKNGLIQVTDLKAYNTTFRVLANLTKSALFVKSLSSTVSSLAATVYLNNCSFDIPGTISNLFQSTTESNVGAPIGAATVINCTFTNRTTVSSQTGSGFVFHGNIFKSAPYKEVVPRTATIAGIDFQDDITAEELKTALSVPTKTSEITNDSGFITQHQDISGKENTSNKVTSLSSSSTDAQYPSAKCVYDELLNYQAKIDNSHKLSSDLVTDENATNQFVTSSDKTTWNGKYAKPSGGIPKADLESAVQTSLGKADSALQTHQDISGKENTSNKVTSLSSSSTDAQYPSAKCVYDLIGNIESLLSQV